MSPYSESHLNLITSPQKWMEPLQQQLLNEIPLTLKQQQHQQQQQQLLNRPVNILQYRQMLINRQRQKTMFLPVILLLTLSHQQHPPASSSNNNNNNCITTSNKPPILQNVSLTSTKPNLSSQPLSSEVTFRKSFKSWTSETRLKKPL